MERRVILTDDLLPKKIQQGQQAKANTQRNSFNRNNQNQHQQILYISNYQEPQKNPLKQRISRTRENSHFHPSNPLRQNSPYSASKDKSTLTERRTNFSYFNPEKPPHNLPPKSLKRGASYSMRNFHPNTNPKKTDLFRHTSIKKSPSDLIRKLKPPSSSEAKNLRKDFSMGVLPHARQGINEIRKNYKVIRQSSRTRVSGEVRRDLSGAREHVSIMNPAVVKRYSSSGSSYLGCYGKRTEIMPSVIVDSRAEAYFGSGFEKKESDVESEIMKRKMKKFELEVENLKESIRNLGNNENDEEEGENKRSRNLRKKIEERVKTSRASKLKGSDALILENLVLKEKLEKFRKNQDGKFFETRKVFERLVEIFARKVKNSMAEIDGKTKRLEERNLILKTQMEKLKNDYEFVSKQRKSQLNKSKNRIKELKDEIINLKKMVVKKEVNEHETKVKEGFGSFRGPNNFFVSDKKDQNRGKFEEKLNRTTHRTDKKEQNNNTPRNKEKIFEEKNKEILKLRYELQNLQVSNQELKSSMKNLNLKNQTLELKFEKLFSEAKDKKEIKVSNRRNYLENNEKPKSEIISTNKEEVKKFSKTHQTDFTKIKTEKYSPFHHKKNQNTDNSISPLMFNKGRNDLENYCRKVEKLQRKVKYLYNEKKKKNYENKKMEDEMRLLKNSLKANQKFMFLMKQEIKHTHNQNKILLNEKEKLESIVREERLGIVVDLAEGFNNNN